MLLLALTLMPVYFFGRRSVPEPGKDISGWRYLFLCVGAGALAFVAGSAAGIWLACSSADAGNLCGLVGIFGLGPLFAGVAIWGCAYFLTRSVKRAS